MGAGKQLLNALAISILSSALLPLQCNYLGSWNVVDFCQLQSSEFALSHIITVFI